MLYKVVIPLLLLVVPWLMVRYVFVAFKSRHTTYRQSLPYLIAAAAFWTIGMLLPGFSFGGTDTFGMHVIGGIAASILFWYAARAYGLHFPAWWVEPVALYFFVSGLGVLNELLEFSLHQARLLADKGGDTWWDLLANVCGAVLSLTVVYLARRFRTSR